jgi:hypothetical protein
VTYVGGLRARLIRDSVWHAVDEALRALGWYEDHPSRQAVTFVPTALPLDVEVPLNTLGLGDMLDVPTEAEMGSDLTEFAWDMHVDIYGENDDISLHIAGDLEAALAGRMPSIGRGRPVIDVWDYTLATPVVVFAVSIEDVRKAKAHDFPQPWLRFWRSVTFTVIDTYGSAADDAVEEAPAVPGAGFSLDIAGPLTEGAYDGASSFTWSQEVEDFLLADGDADPVNVIEAVLSVGGHIWLVQRNLGTMVTVVDYFNYGIIAFDTIAPYYSPGGLASGDIVGRANTSPPYTVLLRSTVAVTVDGVVPPP